MRPARYKGAHGGRGSGKSHFFGEMLVEECIRQPGTLAVCIREVQKTLADSSKRLVEKKIEELSVQSSFNVLKDRIEAPGNGSIIFQGMQDHTAESIKSLEGFRIAWIDEAQTLSQRSLSLLRPTIRAEDSEIWASWNPRRKVDAIDEFLRGNPPPGSAVVQANWRDNPWFPSVLDEERQLDLERYPERYGHIWEGEYAKAFEGAYFATLLTKARLEKRITRCPIDPMMPIRAFWDLGGAGAKADAMAIWLVQWIDREICVVDYIEGVGQTLAYYVNELRRRGYGQAICYLPHDGVHHNNITGKRYADHLGDAEFSVFTVPNQGAGAAMMRVEAVRRILPRCVFDEAKTEPGRDALGFYHERKDEARNVGLGPDHDWSSHAADAFGLMAVCYEGSDKAMTIDSLFGDDFADSTRSSITGY